MFDYKKYSKIKETIEKMGKNTKIIAISKNHPYQSIEEAINHKVFVFGENRVQEAKKKFEELKKANRSIELHLTGPLQTNKVKQALTIFDVFHTIDREKLLKEISKFKDRLDNKRFFIQVNTGKEPTKSGVYPENTENFLDLSYSYGIKNIKGLMCIPPIEEDPKKHFEIIKNLCDKLGLKELSIGMSSDYLDALEFNPTYIRLGTILFGKRT
tara:strand:+ start:123 stop:761 length:639 start_codon:yes stop_codon:yes gene_type:complete